MSELRSGLTAENDPDAVVRRAATNLPTPQTAQILPFQPTTSAAPAALAPASRSSPAATRDQTVAWWVQNAGVPVHVAQGIADNVERESGFRPDLISPDAGGPSGGLYQAHLDRLASLQQNENWKDPNVQHAWALKQVTGGDQIATQHWNEIRNAKTREEANQLWKQYFERPAGSAGHEQDQALTSGHAELSRIGEQTRSLINKLLSEGGRSEATWKRLGEAQDKMREYSERALKLAEKPPSADPREPMQKLGGLATIVGILGGLLTKTPLTASLNAGAAAMDAYKAQDDTAYKRATDQWKYHTDTLLKMAQFEHTQYKDILDDEKLTASERHNKLVEIASLLGQERLATQARLGDERAVRQHVDVMEQAQRNFDLQIKKLAESERKSEAALAETKRLHDAQIKKWEAETEGGGMGKTDIDRQAQDILRKRAQDRNIPYEVIIKDPEERRTARLEAASQMGESRSPGVAAREQAQADTVVTVLDQADELKGLISRGLTVGLGGKIMRPTESLENMLNLTDDTTRRQVESEIALLKMTAGRLLTNRSIVTGREAAEMDKIVRGMHMGDTIQNSLASIETMQKFIMSKNRSLLKKHGYGDDVAGPEQPPPSQSLIPAPTVPEWQSAPVVQ